MTDTFQKLSKSTAVLSVANAIQAIASLVLLPIYTRYLTPADYGLAELLITSIALSTLVTGQGIPSAVSRRVNFVHRDDPAAQNISISTAILYVTFCGLVFFLAVSLCRTMVSEAVMDSPRYSQLVLVGLVVTLARGVVSTCDTTLRAHFRATAVGVIRLTNFVVRAGLILYLLVSQDWGFESLIYGLAGAEIISFSLALFLCRRYLVPRFSREELRAMLLFGLPLVAAGASSFVLSLSNRYFLNYLTDASEVGLYSMADRVASTLNLLVFIPLLGMVPAAFFEIATRDDDTAPRQFARFATQFAAGGALLVAGMLLFADVVIYNLFAEDFHASASAVGILALGYFLLASSDLTTMGLFITGKTLYHPLRLAIAAVSNVGLNLLLIPHYGFEGAAFATILSYGILLVFGLLFTRRQYPVPYEWKKIFIVVVGGVAITAGYFWTTEFGDIARFGARLGLLATYALFLLLTRVLEPGVLLRVIRNNASDTSNNPPG